MRTISAAIQFTAAPNPLNRPCTITSSLSHDRSWLILHSVGRKALDQIEQALTTGSNVRAVLDVVRRPKLLCGSIIVLVKECVERFQNEGLVLFGFSLWHLDL